MADKRHTWVNNDLLTGNQARTRVISVLVVDDNNKPVAVDNGVFVEITDAKPTADQLAGAGYQYNDEGEVFIAKKPTAKTARNKVAFVSTPEVLYDERQTVFDFYNEAGVVARAYLTDGADREIISMTIEGFEDKADPKPDNIVELGASFKPQLVKTATAGSTTIGKIYDIREPKPGLKLYSIKFE